VPSLSKKSRPAPIRISDDTHLWSRVTAASGSPRQEGAGGEGGGLVEDLELLDRQVGEGPLLQVALTALAASRARREPA